MGDNRGGESRGELVICRTEDNATRVQVRPEDESVWMTQAAMAELFRTTVANINIHLKNIYEENELDEVSTVKDYLIVQTEGVRDVMRKVKHYNLETIIPAGNRSHPMSTPFPATKPSPCGRGRGGAGVRGVEDRHVEAIAEDEGFRCAVARGDSGEMGGEEAETDKHW
jgi:hypothetical protein